MMKRTTLLVLVLVAGTTRFAHAQEVPRMVSGRVFDDTTGCPLRGVAVAVQSASAKTVTDANGRYYLKGLPITSFTLQASLVGYVTANSDNIMVSDSAARVDFSLVRALSDLNAKPVVRYPSLKCVLDWKDSGGMYDRR